MSFLKWPGLTLLILLTYLPFMGTRVVRVGGDDKVYVAQAIEMERAGTWFQQRLFDGPNYYKGPLHYLALRLGTLAFGHTMWATLWMNLAAVLIAGIATASLLRRRIPDGSRWGFLGGAAVATSAGVFAHAFASQMEAELVGAYALALYCLDRADSAKRDAFFWVVVGLAGWIKSPLHSALLGASAILFWFLTGRLWPRLKSPRAWGAVVLGVLVCCAGYAVPLLTDWEAFRRTYLLRETFDRPGTPGDWHEAVTSLLSYSLWPWMIAAWISLLEGAVGTLFLGWRRRLGEGQWRLVLLGVSLILPTVVFFANFRFKGHNYDLPTMSGVVAIVIAIASASRGWVARLQARSFALIGLLVWFLAGAWVVFYLHWDPRPEWLPAWPLGLIAGAWGISGGLWILSGFRGPPMGLRRVAWGAAFFYVGIGALMSVVGKRELLDFQTVLAERDRQGLESRIRVVNFNRNIWNEWGYLNYQIERPVFQAVDLEALGQEFLNNDVILASSEGERDAVLGWARGRGYTEQDIRVTPWRRWKTRAGESSEGGAPWARAWEERDLKWFEKNYWIIERTSARPRS